MYIERNLRRDYTPADLNISDFKALRIKWKLKLQREFKKRLMNPHTMWTSTVKAF